MRNHYHWLDKHLITFYRAIGFPDAQYMGDGGIVAHGDKCYGYRSEWEAAGIPFEHGVAIYLLTYLRPYSKEVRDTANGWVAPKDWVIANYKKFVNHLPTELDNNDIPACKCVKSGDNDHSCPYSLEINKDSKTCNCCRDCTKQCSDEI